MAHISNLEAQYELEADDDSEFEEGSDEEYSDDHEAELDSGGGYAERFQELAMREFETEEELETGIRDILGEMEQQYFLGGLLKKGVSFAKKAAGNFARKGLGRLVSKLPLAGIVKKASSLMGPTMTKWLTDRAIALVPGGDAVRSIAKGLGIDPLAGMAETWERFAEVAQEIYETAADQATEEMVDPVKAAQQAVTAIGTVVPQAIGAMVPKGLVGGMTNMAGMLSPADMARLGASTARPTHRTVRLRRGESVTIVCK